MIDKKYINQELRPLPPSEYFNIFIGLSSQLLLILGLYQDRISTILVGITLLVHSHYVFYKSNKQYGPQWKWKEIK